MQRTTNNKTKLNEYKIRQQIRHILVERRNESGLLVEQGEGFRKGGFWDDWAKAGGFFAIFIEPVTDVLKTFKWGVTRTVRSFRKFFGEITGVIGKSVGLVSEEEFEAFRQQEQDALKAIDNKYNEVLQRNKDAMFGGAAAGYAMMFNPGLFIGAWLTKKSPEIAAGVLRVMSGDDSDVNKALDGIGLKEKPVDRFRLDKSGNMYQEQEYREDYLDRRREMKPYMTTGKVLRKRAGYEPKTGVGATYLNRHSSRYGGSKKESRIRPVYVNLLIEQDSEGEINPEQEKKIIQLFLNSAGPKYDEIEKIIGRQIPNDIRSIKPLQIIDAKSKKFSNAAVEELAKSHQKILTRIKDILSSKSPQELNTKLGKEIIPIAKGPDLKDKQFKEFLKSFAQDVVKGNQQSKTENKFYDDLAKINENLVDAFKNILGKKDKDDVSLEKLPPEVLEQAKEEYIKNYNNISMQIALEGLKKAYINGFKTRTDPRSSAAIVPELQQKYVELVSQIEAIPILGEKE
jgi:hypothetical protein